VVGAADRLDAMGLIHHQKAPPGQRGWQSAMCGTPELIQIVDRITMRELQLVPLREPLLLRDADKALVDYRDNRETDRMRKEIEAQNEAIAAVDLGEVVPFPGRLRRIFNQDFAHGGRFYAEGGSWQTLSKAERQRITIEGEPVVEVDYSAFHPTLAYCEHGLPPPPEPYAVPGFPRDLVKITFNVMLNSSNWNRARHTVARKPAMATYLLGLERGPDEDLDTFWRKLVVRDPAYAQRASQTAKRLLEAILDRHDGIRSMFFTGAGGWLQKRDSDIAEAVMGRMRRQGVVCLPIHDSFLVAASKAALLEQAMIEEAQRFGVAARCKSSSYVSAS
jgi:hypothetical protein